MVQTTSLYFSVFMIRSICSCNVKAIFLPSKSCVRDQSDYFTTPHRLVLKIGSLVLTPLLSIQNFGSEYQINLGFVKTTKTVLLLKLLK